MPNQLTAGGGNEGTNITGDEVYRRDLAKRLKEFVAKLFKKMLADVADFDTRPFPLARSVQMNVNLSDKEVVTLFRDTAKDTANGFAALSLIEERFDKLEFESLDKFRQFLELVAKGHWKQPHGTKAVFDWNHPPIVHLWKDSEVHTQVSFYLKLRQT